MSQDKVHAVIRRPAKNAMQSGKYRGDLWYVEFAPSSSTYREHLMGWTGSMDTSQQVRLTFRSKEAAIEYAEAHGLTPVVLQEQVPKKSKKSYAENFLRERGL